MCLSGWRDFNKSQNEVKRQRVLNFYSWPLFTGSAQGIPFRLSGDPVGYGFASTVRSVLRPSLSLERWLSSTPVRYLDRFHQRYSPWIIVMVSWTLSNQLINQSSALWRGQGNGPVPKRAGNKPEYLEKNPDDKQSDNWYQHSTFSVIYKYRRIKILLYSKCK